MPFEALKGEVQEEEKEQEKRTVPRSIDQGGDIGGETSGAISVPDSFLDSRSSLECQGMENARTGAVNPAFLDIDFEVAQVDFSPASITCRSDKIPQAMHR